MNEKIDDKIAIHLTPEELEHCKKVDLYTLEIFAAALEPLSHKQLCNALAGIFAGQYTVEEGLFYIKRLVHLAEGKAPPLRVIKSEDTNE